uniref:Uncharacterized protein n=1 Tax=Anguilla anguilla TaxID=7936 RepID=A0A0E9PTG6_ANGAN
MALLIRTIMKFTLQNVRINAIKCYETDTELFVC